MSVALPTSVQVAPHDVDSERGISSERAQRPCGLAQLDERIRHDPKPGIVLAQTTDAATAEAVRYHVVRRASRQPGRVVLTLDVDFVDGCFRDLSVRLGVPRLAGDPMGAARQIAEASEGTTMVLAGNLDEGSWDATVLGPLGSTACRGLAVVVDTGAARAAHMGLEAKLEIFEIRGESRETARIWWDGVVEALVEAGPPGSLSSLERWWRGAGRLPSQPSSQADDLSDEAKTLLDSLAAARRAWPIPSVERLSSTQVSEELVRAGVLRKEQGFLVVDQTQAEARPLDASRCGWLADVMLEEFVDDGWGLTRASLLLLESGDATRAQEQLERALDQAASVAMRRDLWALWMRHLAHRAPASHRRVALWSAHLALHHEDVDAALELAGEAQRGLPEPTFETALVTGRAQLARGDIVGSRVSLGKARMLASDDAARGEVLSSEAAAAFWAGELERAATLAEQAILARPSAEARLGARNVIGKVLLAQASWGDAESSFAEDEVVASSERLTDALSRARVNRAVALLSSGQMDAARRILEAVLDEGRRERHPRAVAIALSNLGVLAHYEHRYAEALDLYQRAIQACHELGDRLGLARPAANLAELRLELGLIDEAEQALKFARCTLSAGIPASIAPQLALLEANIHLERGDSSLASRAAREALANVDRSTNGAKTGECYRMLARIALHDGNIAAVEDAIDACQEHAESARAEAETTWLEARLARSQGRDAAELSRRAASIAREAGDRELQRACSVLLAEIALSDGDGESARRHVRAAQRTLRDMTRGLPESLVRSLHSRRDIRAMQDLAFAIEQVELSPVPQSPDSLAAGPQSEPSAGFIGADSRVKRLLAMVQRVAANSDAPVLIHGESGTGKELIAEAMHRCSARRDKPLVKVNCAALVETLLLSELFGHEKGAFTGASARRRGRFELADGGVLFLDEIGDISPRTQVALLRVLQDGTFERVGGGSPLHTDVRVVCATHRDLTRMVSDGTFREDLYYRLCGVVLEVPALRDRGDDIRMLANHFLHQIASDRKEPVRTLTIEALDVLRHHMWPGNVRELQNVLSAATLFADGLIIGPELIRDQILPSAAGGSTFPEAGPVSESRSAPPPSSGSDDPSQLAFERIRQGRTSLSEMKRNIERECILRALEETDGNITRAASLLGMKRPRLSQIIKELGLQKGSEV